MEKHAALVEAFLASLLGKRKRRFPILWCWHARQPVKGETTTDVVYRFVRLLLFSPLQVEMTRQGLTLWPGEPNLMILYSWLTEEELLTIKWLFRNRHTVFRSIRQSDNGDFELSKCKLQVKLSLQHRRELVRDFLFMSQMQKPAIAAHLRFALRQAIEQLILEGKVDDLFGSVMVFLNRGCGLDKVLTQT